MRNIALQPLALPQPPLALISAQIAYDGSILILETDKIPERIKGMFVPTKLNNPYYKVSLFQNGAWQCIELKHPHLNFHSVQKIDDEHLLLIASRTSSLTPNACIYTHDGVLESSFLLDDGIESVAVTQNKEIWVSYFDEGVFSGGEISRYGVVKTDLTGHVLWNAESFDIADCYAMNVDTDDSCWFYYYTDFMLVHVKNGQTQSYNPKINGSSSFAVLGQYILMQNGYNKNNQFTAFELRGEQLIKKDQYQFSIANGASLNKAYFQMRANHVLAVEDKQLYYGKVEYLDFC